MNVRHRISNGQLNAGIPQVNTKLILKTNWALVLTLDHSERDRLKEALPINLLENFRMVNLITQNLNHIISVQLMIMGFENPSLTTNRLLMFLQFFSTSLENHDYILYETIDKEELSLESRAQQGLINLSFVNKRLDTLLQKLYKNGFTEKATDLTLFEAVKVIIQTQLNIAQSAKITTFV